MYCPHCGAALEPGMRFCPGCGAPRGTSPRPAWETGDPEPDTLPWDSRPAQPMRIAADLPSPPPTQVVIVHEHRYRPADPGKSFFGWAWLTLLLYGLLYIPGLIANVILWRSSVSYERETGVRARGSGCLVWLLWVVGVGIPLLLLIGASGGG